MSLRSDKLSLILYATPAPMSPINPRAFLPDILLSIAPKLETRYGDISFLEK